MKLNIKLLAFLLCSFIHLPFVIAKDKYQWRLVVSTKAVVGCYVVKGGKVFLVDGDEDVLVKNADIATFRAATKNSPLGTCWAKDKNHLFHDAEIIANVDLTTFALISDQIGKDKNHVYCPGANELTKIADPRTFILLTDKRPNSQFWYYKDEKHVFNKWCTLMPYADPSTFEMAQNPTVDFDAQDKNYIYGLGTTKKKK